MVTSTKDAGEDVEYGGEYGVISKNEWLTVKRTHKYVMLFLK